MLTATALAFINHLLTGKIGEAWATARPRPFAGRTMYVRCPPDDRRIVRVDIDVARALRAAPDIGHALPEAPPDADIRLPPLTPLTFLPDAPTAATRQSLAAGFVDPSNSGSSQTPARSGTLVAADRIEGAANRADALAFTLRNLRRDVEDALPRCVGDLADRPVRRLAQRGRAVFSGVSRAARAFARNFAEYFSEKEKISPIVGQAEMGTLARAINALTRDTTSPEQRPGRLGSMEIRTCADPQ